MGGDLGGEWIHGYVWLSPFVGRIWHVDVLLGIHGRYLLTALLVLLLLFQACPTLYDPIDGSPPGSAISGILQARTLEWVAIFFSNLTPLMVPNAIESSHALKKKSQAKVVEVCH